jgi:hypothetical protein
MPVRQNLNMPIPARPRPGLRPPPQGMPPPQVMPTWAPIAPAISPGSPATNRLAEMPGSPATNRLAEMYNRRPAGLASLVAPPRTPIGGDEDRQRLMEMQRETYRNFLDLPEGQPPGLPPGSPTGGTPIYDPTAPGSNLYGGEGPAGVPLSAEGSGFRLGDRRPRRADYDAETGYMEYVKAIRGWNAAQGNKRVEDTRTTQELARLAMIRLGMRPPDTRSETGLASIPPSLLPNFSPNIGLGGTPISVAPNVAAPPIAAPAPPGITQKPSRSDYEAEGGASEYRHDLRDWLASQNGASGYQGGGRIGPMIPLKY